MACPEAAPAGPGRQARPSSPAAPRPRPCRKRGRAAVDVSKTVSSLSRDARVIVNTFQGDAGAAPFRHFAGAQMPGKHVPHRLALLLIEGSPSRHLVALAGFDRAAVVELEVGNPASDRFGGRASVGDTADADHVAALLIIGIGIEQIIADV